MVPAPAVGFCGQADSPSKSKLSSVPFEIAEFCAWAHGAHEMSRMIQQSVFMSGYIPILVWVKGSFCV